MTRRLADAQAVRRLVRRVAADIHRLHRRIPDLALVGIKRRGVPLAERLAALLEPLRSRPVPVGAIDITLYRDDLKMVCATPLVRGTEIGFDLTNRTLVLVDDVLFTGRTVRAALSELLDYGRPRAIRLAVLFDRGLRELPIQPDVVARVLRTEPEDLVDIYLEETDGRDEVVLTRGKPDGPVKGRARKTR